MAEVKTLENDTKYEMLTDSKYDRLSIEPIQFNDIWSAYKKHEAAIWHSSEILLDRDVVDWEALNDDERYFLKNILGFFVISDIIVSQNIAVRFLNEITIPEVKFYYGLQLMMENIHSEVYSKIVTVYITDMTERMNILDSATKTKCIEKKTKWAKKWIESDETLPTRILAFSMVEGIFFSGCFCAIYWVVERGILPGLKKSNEFIARDEGMHTEFACMLYNKYVNNKVSKEKYEIILKEAVEIEINFITKSLPCRLVGINSDSMTKYIKMCANRLSVQLSHDEIYSAKDTNHGFSFMNRIGVSQKSNFFEEEVTTYSKFNYKQKTEYTDEDIYAGLI